MTWYLRGLRFGPVIGVAVALGLVAGVVRGAQAPVPSLTQGSLAPVPVVAVLALLPSLLVLGAWLAMPAAAMVVSVRSTMWGPTAMMAVCLAYAIASAVFGHGGALVENARNSLGTLGLALIGTRGWGQRGGVAVPVAYLLGSFLLGREAGSAQPSAWAWVLRDGGDATALVLAGILAVVGLTAALTVPRASVLRGEA